MASAGNENYENWSFEQAYSELDSVLAQLESGEVPLEDAVILYERGRQLAVHCQALLDQAELRISRLHDDGSITSHEA